MTSLGREILFLKKGGDWTKFLKKNSVKGFYSYHQSSLSQVESTVLLHLRQKFIHEVTLSAKGTIFHFYSFYTLISNKALNIWWITLPWQCRNNEICSKEEMPGCLYLFLPFSFPALMVFDFGSYLLGEILLCRQSI